MTDLISNSTVEAINRTVSKDIADVKQRLADIVEATFSHQSSCLAPSLEDIDPYEDLNIAQGTISLQTYEHTSLEAMSHTEIQSMATTTADVLFHSYE